LAVAVFTLFRKYIFKKAKNTVKDIGKENIVTINTNSSIGKTYKINKDGSRIEVQRPEQFDIHKFVSGLNPFNLKVWAKSIVFLFRYFLIISIVLSAVYGYGWWKGRSNAPVQWQFDYKSEFTLEVPKGVRAFYKPANSNLAYWIDSNGKKTVVKVKDIPELQKLLKPIALEVVPIVVGGYGIGESGGGLEGGIGVSLVRLWKWRIEPFITNRGIYVGTSYKITRNSGLGIGAGKGWEGDNRVILYWRIEF